jgi:nitrogen regulatory protein P-II 1
MCKFVHIARIFAYKALGNGSKLAVVLALLCISCRFTHPPAIQKYFLTLPSVKLITTIIRPERLADVKAALFRIGVTGITLSRVSGHGGEAEVVESFRGSSVVIEFRDKVKVEIAVSELFVELTIAAIVSAARTGEVGDGKIFVQPLERVIRIRTGETDVAALTPVTAELLRAESLEAAALV